MKSNGWPMPPGFDRFESYGHDEPTAKHCYFRCSRPPDVDGIKTLIKMTRPQNTGQNTLVSLLLRSGIGHYMTLYSQKFASTFRKVGQTKLTMKI